MNRYFLRTGDTVYIETSMGKFDYILMDQDVVDIRNGEWKEVGIKIIRYTIVGGPVRRAVFSFVTFLFGRMTKRKVNRPRVNRPTS